MKDSTAYEKGIDAVITPRDVLRRAHEFNPNLTGLDDMQGIAAQFSAMWLIACQRPEGGFKFSEELAGFFGMTEEEMIEHASFLSLPENIDALNFIVSCLAMGFLECRYVGSRDVWEPMVISTTALLKEMGKLIPGENFPFITDYIEALWVELFDSYELPEDEIPYQCDTPV